MGNLEPIGKSARLCFNIIEKVPRVIKSVKTKISILGLNLFMAYHGQEYIVYSVSIWISFFWLTVMFGV